MQTRARRSSWWLALFATAMLWSACDRETRAEQPKPVDKPIDKPVDKPVERGAKQMSWMDVARMGKFMPPNEVDQAAEALAKRPNHLKERAEPVLADMAATSPDAAGIKRAIARLDSALPGFAHPEMAVGGGDEPDVGAVKQCGFVLYHGLLARAGTAVKALPKPDDAAVALVAAARSIDGYRQALKDSLLDEVMGALGFDLYKRATATLDARNKP